MSRLYISFKRTSGIGWTGPSLSLKGVTNLAIFKKKSNWRVWIAAAAVTAGMASIVYRRLYYRTIPNRILSIVKANFTNRGTIENSWINMQPTERGTGRDRYRVYTGGLTVREGDRLNQFAFAVEPDGTLRQLKQLHEPINA